jgi:type II secretory pathway predicted ATPase ExeA
MSSQLGRRLAASDLAHDEAQLHRQTTQLAEAYTRYAADVANPQRLVVSEAQRLATDALEVLRLAGRVEGGRQTMTYLTDPNTTTSGEA